MRFYVSFDWKTIKKFLIPFLAGICFYFASHTTIYALAVDNGTFAFGYSAGTTGTLTYSSNYDTPNQSNSFLNPFPNKDFQRAVFQVKFGTITEEDPGYYFFRFWFPTACQNIEKYRGVSQYTSVYHDWLPANDAVLNGVNYCIVSYAYDFTALKTGDYARLYINTNNLRNFGTDGWYSGFVYEKISFNDYNSFMQDIRTENDDTNDKIIAEQEKTNEELGNIKDQITDLEGTINDNFNSCRPSKNLFNKNDVSNGTYLDADGNVQVNEYWVTSNYIPIESNSKYTYQGLRSIGLAPHWAYYDSNKQFISSFKPVVPAGTITTPSNAKYIRVVVNFGDTSLFQFEKGTYSSPYEEYGKEVCTNKIDDTNENLENIHGSITDSNVDDSTAGGFFNDFEVTDNGGISEIVTMPLTLVNALLGSSNSCPDLEFPILGKDVSMPSGCILWNKAPDSVVTIYQTIVCGLSAYYLLTSLFKDIEKLKDPGNKEVSTLDL